MRHDIHVGATSEVGPPAAVVVGEWYLESRSAHRDPQVIGAYRQLQLETDHLFSLLTREGCHRSGPSGLHPLSSPLRRRRRAHRCRTHQRDARGHLCHHCPAAPASSLSTVRSVVRLIAFVPSTISSVMPGADTGSISMTSTPPGRSRPPPQWSRTVRARHRALWSERHASHHRGGARSSEHCSSCPRPGAEFGAIRTHERETLAVPRSLNGRRDYFKVDEAGAATSVPDRAS